MTYLIPAFIVIVAWCKLFQWKQFICMILFPWTRISWFFNVLVILGDLIHPVLDGRYLKWKIRTLILTFKTNGKNLIRSKAFIKGTIRATTVTFLVLRYKRANICKEYYNPSIQMNPTFWSITTWVACFYVYNIDLCLSLTIHRWICDDIVFSCIRFMSG